MPFPPIDKSFEGLLRDLFARMMLVERRLAKGGDASSLPNRLGPDLATLGSGKDLNTIRETGWYIQSASANATLALNYPIARAGHLEVSFSTEGSDFGLQNYTEYLQGVTGHPARRWQRTYYNGTWQAWTEVQEGYRLVQTVKFTANGTFTPASYLGLRAVKVRVQAGGGAGGSSAAATTGHSAGGGGGGGGYAESFLTATQVGTSAVAVTVGAGGSPATSTTGGPGGDSSFGSLVVATGGRGGGYKNNYTSAGVPAASSGGDGGIGTDGDILVGGSGGGLGQGLSTIGHGGFGGGSCLGGGAVGTYTGAGGGEQVGAPGRQYGGGGGGASVNSNGSAVLGGAGAPGIVIVEIYK